MSDDQNIAALADVLAYEFPWIVPKFRERYAVSEAEARDIFMETKRFLWLVAYSQTAAHAPRPLTIIGLDALSVVDEMWHSFILFTEAYSAFCARYFGRYLHHMPATHADHEQARRAHESDPEAFVAQQLREFRVQARFVGETLGVETVKKWFRTYEHRYAPRELDRLLIPRVALPK